MKVLSLLLAAPAVAESCSCSFPFETSSSSAKYDGCITMDELKLGGDCGLKWQIEQNFTELKDLNSTKLFCKNGQMKQSYYTYCEDDCDAATVTEPGTRYCPGTGGGGPPPSTSPTTGITASPTAGEPPSGEDAISAGQVSDLAKLSFCVSSLFALLYAA